MIETAQEFYRLRTSEVREEYYRADSEDAPLAVWREVISTMPDMKEWVVINKTVPLEILDALVHDPDVRVRYSITAKRKLPERLQLVLARDTDETVRHRIACNRKATKKALEILGNDAEEFVRQRALERLQKGDYANPK